MYGLIPRGGLSICPKGGTQGWTYYMPNGENAVTEIWNFIIIEVKNYSFSSHIPIESKIFNFAPYCPRCANAHTHTLKNKQTNVLLSNQTLISC